MYFIYQHGGFPMDYQHILNYNMDWSLEIAFHWPHDRFCLGWEVLNIDEEHDYVTINIFLLFCTLTLEY